MALGAHPPLVSTAPPTSLLEWWHLLSLDAATVAGLWSYTFARATGMRLPLVAQLLLAAGTWLVYVADRILDGLHPQTILRKRHFFYAEHRLGFGIAALVVGCCLGWLVITRMQPDVRREDALLFVAALIYFALVHSRGRSVERWLPKELAVGLLFAAATAIPTWARLTSGHGQLVPSVALFAILCWVNCVAIEQWESGDSWLSLSATQGSSIHLPHASTCWAGHHLQQISAGLGLASALLAAVTCHAATPGLVAVDLAVLVSAGIFVLLDSARSRLSALHLRIAADAALLTPLLFLFFLHG